MNKLIDKHGAEIEPNTLIMWKCWDSDDFITWTFYGIVRKDHVVYLGGGIDFGAGIGKKLSIEGVQDDSENNDSYDAGIQVIGKGDDVTTLLSKTYKDNWDIL